MAIAFDSSASGTGLGVEGHLSHTSSGSNRILFAFICGASAGAFVSATCDGVAMTKIANTGGISGFSMVAFYILGQKTGTNDIQFNWGVDTGSFFSMWSSSYTGSNGFDGSGWNLGTSSGTVTTSVTTTLANSWVLTSLFANGGGFSNPTGYTNRVPEFSDLSGFSAALDDSNAGLAAGSHSITWNFGASTGGAMAIGIAAGSQPTNDNCIFFAGD